MRKLTVLFLCVLVSASFAGKKSRQMQQEIATLKKSSMAQSVVIADIQKTIADIQKTQHEIVLNQERFAVMLDDISPTRLEELEIQLAYLTEAFRDLFTQVRGIQLIPIVQQAQRTAPRPAGFAVSKASGVLGGDEYALYSRALDSFRKRFFDESRQVLRELIMNFPDGQYSDRAHFWIAESYFQQKNYSSALEYYQKTLNFAGSSKEDDAQYRIAICYLLSGENDKAFEEFTRLVQRYPASTFVPRANDALRRITEQRNRATAQQEEE